MALADLLLMQSDRCTRMLHDRIYRSAYCKQLCGKPKKIVYMHQQHAISMHDDVAGCFVGTPTLHG